MSISIYKVLQLDDENRNMDMELLLEETFATYQKLIENSNVVRKKINDKLTLVDVEGNLSVSGHHHRLHYLLHSLYGILQQ